MSTPSSIPLGKRIFASFGISWLAAVSLGIIYGARVVGRVSISDLWVMGVIQIATIVSTVIAIFLTPLTAWVLQSYASIKWIFCLWLLLIIWIFAAFAARLYGLIIDGALLLSIGGLVGIRFIARR
jgi:hypothetical protein